MIHLVLEPHSHKLVALKIAKDSLARIYPATSGNDFFFFHLRAIL